MQTILIVDDEDEIRNLLEIYIKNEGFKTLTAYNGDSTFKILKNENVDLIILDILLPDINGIQICKKIKTMADIPILMISAKGESNDKILGIISGADDYVAKPFNPLEVVVRAKSLLKRYISITEENLKQITIDDLIIDIETHKVKLDNVEIILTKKEFEILKLLASNRSIVFSSRKIYETVWGEDFYESDATIMTHIANIRDKLGDTTKNARFIKTIWGVGYRID